MPNFKDHPRDKRVKALVCGDPGSGKTGALASLLNADYSIAVLDFDNGLDILHSYIEEDKAGNLDYFSFDVENQETPTLARNILRHWKTDVDLGPVTEWGSDKVIVIDSASLYGECLLAHSKKSDGRMRYFDAGQELKQVILFLTGPQVKCNVIVNTHIQTIENDQGLIKGYPQMIGSAVSKAIGRYFNNLWRLDSKRMGRESVPIIRTKSDSFMALKCSAPKVVEAEHPLDYAELFQKIKHQTQKVG